MVRRPICIILVLTIGLLFACSSKKEGALRIAAAANTQFAIAEIIKAFEESRGIECDLIVGSSGRLTAQIREGAPFDYFISADLKYPWVLHAAELTIGEPRIYGLGQLVLWSEDTTSALALDRLLDEEVKYIAIANPKTAPYGQAAVEVLKSFNIFDDIQDKLVYGESVTQVNQFLLSGAAQIGITAKSIMSLKPMIDKGQSLDIPTDYHTPLTQASVILKKSESEKTARSFHDFLFSPEGKEILVEYGYQTD